MGISEVGQAALHGPVVDSDNNMLAHQFNIRPNVEISFRPPVDRTKPEAKRLARHL
ncbi:MAG: hypothetical protein RJP95_01150 [Pirellulales bacterium]